MPTEKDFPPPLRWLDALRRALELEPESRLVRAKLAEVEASQREEAARQDECEELPPNAIDIGARRFADTPLGRLCWRTGRTPRRPPPRTK